MDTKRQQKIAQVIKKELADIFLIEGKSVYNCLITVTKTTVTKDLSIARSYISIYSSANKEDVITAIKNNSNQIRFKTGQKLKNQLRIIPSLEFYLDDSLDYIENIDRLLKQ